MAHFDTNHKNRVSFHFLGGFEGRPTLETTHCPLVGINPMEAP